MPHRIIGEFMPGRQVVVVCLFLGLLLFTINCTCTQVASAQLREDVQFERQLQRLDAVKPKRPSVSVTPTPPAPTVRTAEPAPMRPAAPTRAADRDELTKLRGQMADLQKQLEKLQKQVQDRDKKVNSPAEK